ncbi:MAG: glycoside hydrolase family 3 C-terminal domain-containing protein [Acidobacteriota bacterium]|nr:MAG: glycoside hydrolase family 3 C-terminal domain-containing protein [Acidobacteriota bacterium]
MKEIPFGYLLLILLLGFATCSGPSEPTVSEEASPPVTGIDFTLFDTKVDPLLAQMTLDEKIGQMTQPDQDFLKSDDEIAELFLGSVLSGGNSDPEAGNSIEAWTEMYERYQAEAGKTRLKIPLLFGVDAVHGHSNVIGAVLFPHNIGLGCTRNEELIEEVARITAVEVKATGIHWTFAPCVTVPRDLRWGRVYEGFSEEPELVARLGAAATRGLQGTDLSAPLSVLACAKHFLGDGGTTWGTGTVRRGEDDFYPIDRGDTRLEEADFRRIHLAGYPPSIQWGAGSIMPSYSSWNGEKLSGHKYLLTDVLKQELGFEGFLISDYNAIDELPGDYREQVKRSVMAGMDMFMVPERYREFIGTLKSLVEDGEVPLERIDDAVRRILRVKLAMGLFDKDNMADPELRKLIGSPEHREVARDAVRQSLVLLKNEGNALPIRKEARIHVAGRGADDLGMQCGGWSIDWQGGSGEITEGTTILQAVKAAVTSEAGVTYSKDGSAAAGSDVAVVVIGESPYAEFMGDREDLSLSSEDVEAVQNAKKAGVPVVVVLLTGRPVLLDSILDEADAIVAAWWPGTEGQGVADVLLGDFNPTGKLSFTWPRDMSQADLNVGDAVYDPLFPFGFGLSY